MSGKSVLFDNEARSKVFSGIDTVANAVKVTLGPGGGNVVMENEWGLLVSNDGYTISKQIDLEDKFENIGAKLVNQVAERTNKFSKGGRTTAVTIAQELIKHGRRHVEAGTNPMKLKIGMEEALKEAKEQVKSQAKEVTDVSKVATISAESEEIGGMVAKVLKEVGQDGVVAVEGTNKSETSYEIVNGMDFDKGFISPYFINVQERQECVLHEAKVLVTDKKLSNGAEMVGFMGKVKQAGYDNLVVIAEDVTDQALATMVVNRVQGNMNSVAIKAPEHSNYTKQMLEDIAFLTGTQVVSEASGKKIDSLDPDELGTIKKITVSQEKTTMTGGVDVSDRVEVLKYQLSKEKDEYEINRLKKRIAKLSAGVCVINVGAPTEAELIYKRQKTEDAVNDAKSALEEGVVCGGGISLARVKLNKTFNDKDIQAGYDIVKDSLPIQLKQIVENTGERNGVVVLSEVLKSGENYGYDAKNNVFIDDMLKAGIVDSAKVTRMVLENAVSLAGIALTIRAAIAEIPKEENK